MGFCSRVELYHFTLYCELCDFTAVSSQLQARLALTLSHALALACPVRRALRLHRGEQPAPRPEAPLRVCIGGRAAHQLWQCVGQA
eukprot:scaffold18970_cov18-Tisochrysis_lutea.AAC.2